MVFHERNNLTLKHFFCLDMVIASSGDVWPLERLSVLAFDPDSRKAHLEGQSVFRQLMPWCFSVLIFALSLSYCVTHLTYLFQHNGCTPIHSANSASDH